MKNDLAHIGGSVGLRNSPARSIHPKYVAPTPASFAIIL